MIKFKKLLLHTGIYLCLLNSVGFAGDSTKYFTEEITVFGKTGITSTALLPGFVQLIESDQIKNKNGNDISEVLRLLAGVSIRDYGGGNSLSTVSMNGTGAEHTLILINGTKLNSVQNNQFDLSLLSKGNIDRIEVLSGGMSSIYGSEAIGGVINIVTNKPGQFPSTLNISGGVGSFGLRQFNLSGTKTFGNLNLLLDINDESSDNAYDYYFHSGTEIQQKKRENSSYKQRNISAEINTDLSESSVLTFHTSYLTASRSIPGIETGSLPSNSFQEDAQWRTSLSLVSKLSGNIVMTGKLGFSNDLLNYSDRLLTQSYYKNLSLVASADADFNFGAFNGNGGIEINKYVLQSNETVSGIERWQPAIYAGGEFEISELLRIYPSARVDLFSDIDKAAATANIGVNYKPLKRHNLYIKARAGNNFAAPTFNELYWKTGGNELLQPERSINYSLGMVMEFPAIVNSSVELSYNKVHTSEKIIWMPQSSGYWTPQNLRETVSDALILNIGAAEELGMNTILSAKLSIAYTNARKTKGDFEGDINVGKQLAYVPELTTKAGLNFTINEFQAGVFYDHTGTRYMNAENTRSLPQAGLLEGSIQYTLPLTMFNVTGRIEANNILNEDYQMIAGYPMPLSNFTFKVNLEFR
mgnify:CR=1 FL=1